MGYYRRGRRCRPRLAKLEIEQRRKLLTDCIELVFSHRAA